MPKTVIALRHISFEDLGFFEAPLFRAGYSIRYLDVGKDDLGSVDPLRTPLLVVLGGPMGVYEAERYPFLTEELKLIESRIDQDRPILGICLGAQLIASALGSRVYRGEKKEFGFARVQLTPAGMRSPLAALAREQAVLHWHGDTFDLPKGSELLASTEDYANQAFRRGPNIMALQFHLEAGADIETWLDGHAQELTNARIDPAPIRHGAHRYAKSLRAVAHETMSAWLSDVDDR